MSLLPFDQVNQFLWNGFNTLAQILCKEKTVFELADRWLEKNACHREVSFSQQAFDDDETLHQGVCTAMIYRIMSSLKKQPKQEIQSFFNRIEPKDRFHQAMHHLHMKFPKVLCPRQAQFEHLFDLFKNVQSFAKLDVELSLFRDRIHFLKQLKVETVTDILPASICKKQGVELMNETKERQSLEKLRAILNDLGSDRYLILSIADPCGKGHTLGIQRDDREGIFRFIDPNKGVWKYDNPEELIENVNAYISIFYFSYSEFYLISVS